MKQLMILACVLSMSTLAAATATAGYWEAEYDLAGSTVRSLVFAPGTVCDPDVDPAPCFAFSDDIDQLTGTYTVQYWAVSSAAPLVEGRLVTGASHVEIYQDAGVLLVVGIDRLDSPPPELRRARSACGSDDGSRSGCGQLDHRLQPLYRARLWTSQPHGIREQPAHAHRGWPLPRDLEPVGLHRRRCGCRGLGCGLSLHLDHPEWRVLAGEQSQLSGPGSEPRLGAGAVGGSAAAAGDRRAGPARSTPKTLSTRGTASLERVGIVALLLLALGLSCGGADEPGERPVSPDLESRVEAALADLDIAEALDLIAELEADSGEKPESAIRAARLLGRAGEMNRALWLLESAEVRHPAHRDIKLGLAETAILVGSPARALEALDAIPEDDPQSGYASLLRARALLNLGRLSAAFETLEQALERHPANLELARELIQGLANEKRGDRALEHIHRLLAREDLGAESRRWLRGTEATVMAGQGEATAALERLEALVGERPEDTMAWQRFAELSIRLNEADRVSRLLAAQLERQPNLSSLHPILATTQLADGDAEAATATLRRMVEHDPGPGARLMLAKHLHERGRTAEAVSVLEGADPHLTGSAGADIAYMHAAMLIGSDHPEEGRRAYERFRLRFPRDPSAEYLRARLELIDGDVAAAATRLRQVVSKLDRSDVRYWLGAALELLEDEAGAEYNYGLAITRDEQQVGSYLGLLRMLERRGAWESMAAYAARLVQVTPDNAAGYDALARALLALGRADEAERALRLYRERFPRLESPVVALSASLRQQGKLEQALAEIEAATPEIDSDGRILAERAILLGELGRAGEGLALVERALADGARSAALQRALAFLLFDANRASEAREALEESIRQAPHDPSPLRMLGDHHARHGDFAGARRAYERYLDIRPSDAEVQFRLAAALTRLDEADAAIERYRASIALDDASVKARNNLALLLSEQGRLDEALQAAQAAYARAENEPVVMDTLAVLYLKKGRGERAIALLRAALDQEPTSVETRYHLAMAYDAVGREADARTLVDQLLADVDEGHALHARIDEFASALR